MSTILVTTPEQAGAIIVTTATQGPSGGIAGIPSGSGVFLISSGVPVSAAGVVPVAYGGTGLTSVGTSGYVLTSTGSAMAWEAGSTVALTQLTQDVLAGPGVGSVAATVVQAQDGAVTFQPSGTVATSSTSTLFAFGGQSGAPSVATLYLGLGSNSPDATNWSLCGSGTSTTSINGKSAISFFVGGSTNVMGMFSSQVTFAVPLAGNPSTSPLALASVAVTGITGGNTTLTSAQYTQPIVELKGTLTSASTIILPNVQGTYWFDVSGLSGISGTNTLTFKSGTATTQAINLAPQATSQLLMVSTQGGNTITLGGSSTSVTWADDLANSSATAQYVSSLSYSSSSAGGTIAINGTGTSLQWASGNTGPTISQASTSGSVGAAMSFTPQPGASNGGNFVINLQSGSTGTDYYTGSQNSFIVNQTGQGTIAAINGWSAVAAYPTLWLLAGGASQSSTNPTLQVDGVNTFVNTASGSGKIYFEFAGNVAHNASTAGLTLGSASPILGGGSGGLLSLVNAGTAPTSTLATTAILYGTSGNLGVLANGQTLLIGAYGSGTASIATTGTNQLNIQAGTSGSGGAIAFYSNTTLTSSIGTGGFYAYQGGSPWTLGGTSSYSSASIAGSVTLQGFGNTGSGGSGPVYVQGGSGAATGGPACLQGGTSSGGTAGYAALLTAAGAISVAIGAQGIGLGLGSLAVALSSSPQTLTVQQASNPCVAFTGSLSGNFTVKFPANALANSLWIVDTTAITFNSHSITLEYSSVAMSTTISAGAVWLIVVAGTGKFYAVALSTT